MSDEPKAATPQKRIVRSRAIPRIEPEAPTAAPESAPVERTPTDLLAEAVTQAKAETVPPQVKPAATDIPECRPVGTIPTALKPKPRLFGYAAYGFGLAAAVGLGWTGATLLPLADGKIAGIAAAMPMLTGKASPAPAQASLDARKLADDMRALRDSVVALKSGLNGTNRSKVEEDVRELRQSVAQIGDGVERLKQDAGAKLNQVSAQLDRVERDPSPKLAQIAERLERIERQMAAGVTGSVASQSAAAAPVAAAPAAASKQVVDETSDMKPLAGWVLRDIYGSLALIEGRRGLFEVARGRTYTGIGRIEKFERRGKQWVVVTDKGFIAMN